MKIKAPGMQVPGLPLSNRGVPFFDMKDDTTGFCRY